MYRTVHACVACPVGSKKTDLHSAAQCLPSIRDGKCGRISLNSRFAVTLFYFYFLFLFCSMKRRVCLPQSMRMCSMPLQQMRWRDCMDN